MIPGLGVKARRETKELAVLDFGRNLVQILVLEMAGSVPLYDTLDLYESIICTATEWD